MRRLLALALVMVAVAGCSNKEVRPERGASFNEEESFAKANEHLEKKEYDKARELFLDVRSRDVTGKYSPLAHLRMADSYYNEGEIEQAADEYGRFLEIYPEHRYAPYAQYQKGMVYFTQIADPERGAGAARKALEEFEELKTLYPRNPYKDTVDMRIAKCRDTIASYEFLVGEFYFKKKSYPGAIARLSGILDQYPDFRKEPQVLYMTAFSYNALGEKDKAALYLKMLTAKYPEDALCKKAEKEFGK
jgi:outer membrane protein assembly factor BamD